MSFRLKCRALDGWTSKVENWFFCYGGQSFPPPSFERSMGSFFTKKENIVVASHVEFFNIGKVQKVVTVGSDKYRLTEIPKEMYETILDEFMSDGQDHLVPELFIVDADKKIPKFRLVARWFPPGDYVKELREKRGVLTEREFEMIKPIMTKIYDRHGVQVPNYIDRKPFVQVH